MKRIVCSSRYDATLEILRNIPDDVYRKLAVAEKRILAKAHNSVDPQIYLHGAVEGMELVGFNFSEAFDSIYQDITSNYDFDVYR